jgi:hypothetical protein
VPEVIAADRRPEARRAGARRTPCRRRSAKTAAAALAEARRPKRSASNIPQHATLTKTEQDNLVRIAKLNRDGAIADARRRTADAAADYEMYLASEFAYDQRETWADLMHTAKARISELDNLLAEDCRRLGIPESMRPSINLLWSGRGENASKERQAELRRVMTSRLFAIERTAALAIEGGYRKAMTASLSSEEAHALLADMPSAEQLMPKIDYAEVKRSLLEGPAANIVRTGYAMLTDDGGDEC